MDRRGALDAGPRRPGVCAEDLEAVLRLHVDRVHDAVRRLGVDAARAVGVVERSAVALVDAVAAHPERVPDAVGWWLAEARRLSRGARATTPDLPLGGGLLSSDEDQLVLAEALDGLPEDERLAVLVRDAYRLPTATVAAALGTDEAAADQLVARARLHAVPLLDDEPAPPVPAHAGSLAALGRLGDSDRVTPADATARRHAKTCADCAAVVDAQSRVHLLLSGLAVVALPEAGRTAVLADAEARARAALPPAAALELTEEEWEEWDDESRLLPPLLAALGVVLAVVLGTGVGVLLSRGAAAVLPTSSGVLPAVPLPPVEAPAPLAVGTDLPPPPPVPEPRTTVVVLPPRTTPPAPPPTTAPPSATPSPSASPTPSATGPSLVVDPASGPNGQTVEVRGAGWTPGARVVLEYLDPAGRPTGSRSTAVVDDDGTFSADLVARNPAGIPGRHSVRASEGGRVRSAPYDATT